MFNFMLDVILFFTMGTIGLALVTVIGVIAWIGVKKLIVVLHKLLGLEYNPWW